MIKIERVNKYFNRFRRNQIHVINNTNLEFEENGLVSLLGPSGCGKTTLLNVIGGLDRVNKGKIYIDGEKITGRRAHKIDKVRNLSIGYIFQDYRLVPDMTVFDNVALALKLVGIKNKKEIKERVNYVLETVGMYRYRNRPASMLSGGERQRVGIARAIVKNPKVIIADEPTGNLDSKNTIEVMNIIKAISREKLVILVTHEKELAYFYSSRIVELIDGEVVNDYINDHENDLDYQMDNKIYLKDIEKTTTINKKNCKINTFIDDQEKLNVTVVVKNGNVYIKSNTKNKIEIVDDNSSIEFVDDHYKKINKKDYEKYQFQIQEYSKKLKYSSILNPFTMIFNGFKKVFKYTLVKKLLLLGFFVSAMFILYGVSNIMGITSISEDKYVTSNKNYLIAKTSKMKVSDYLLYEKNEFVDYMLPREAQVTFTVPYNELMQTQGVTEDMTGSLSSSRMITSKDIIDGRMPITKNEIAVDKLIFKNMTDTSNVGKQLGYYSYKDYLNKEVYIKNDKYIIVGFTSLSSPSIYAVDDILLKTLMIFEQVKSGNIELLTDYNEKASEITLSKGKLPVNDYEVIVSEEKKYEMPLNKTINLKVNDIKLKVVGYYKSKNNVDYMLTNFNTIKYNFINGIDQFVVYPKNKEEVLNYFNGKNINIYDSFEKSKSDYLISTREKVNTTVIMASIILSISFIEIFLIVRASFLSRIKEIGVYRAIGVKKSDIYFMFLGEIIAVTTIGGIPGILLMNYILTVLTQSEFVGEMFMLNNTILLSSIIVLYTFNILIGLIPVRNVIKKTPSQILSRTDID